MCRQRDVGDAGGGDANFLDVAGVEVRFPEVVRRSCEARGRTCGNRRCDGGRCTRRRIDVDDGLVRSHPDSSGGGDGNERGDDVNRLILGQCAGAARRTRGRLEAARCRRRRGRTNALRRASANDRHDQGDDDEGAWHDPILGRLQTGQMTRLRRLSASCHLTSSRPEAVLSASSRRSSIVQRRSTWSTSSFIVSRAVSLP